MDLKAQIEQLDRAIEIFETNIATMKGNLKEAKVKRRKFLILEEKAKEIIK